MANPDDIELDQGQNSIPSPEKSTDAKSNHYEETPSPSPSAPGPTAWQFETWIPGGYKQSRMLRFQNPSTMYKMINLFAGIAICFYGYDQGVMSLVNQNPDYQQLMGIYPLEGSSRNTAAEGGIVAVYYGGTLVGALMAGSLADRCGRIKAIVFGCLWALLGSVLQASAYNITWMCCARVICGIGVGSIDCVVPVWSAEVSSHSARGAFLALEFIMNIGGLAMAFWIEYFASLNPNESMAWRTPLALQVVFIVIIGLGINFFPESPRWLMKMGRHDEARDILQATRSGNIEAETQQIIQNVQHEMKIASANQYTAMIFPKDKYTRGLRWRVVLAVWLQIMQELVGIGVITVYAVDLFATAGFSETLSKLLSGFNNISYMFSVFFAVVTLDRYGRRRPHQRKYGSGVAAMTFFYTATFGATWLTTPWLYPTEIFPLTVRAKGGAWSVVGWSIGNGVVTMITPFLFQAIGYGTLLLLCGLNFCVIPFLLVLYPETAGRSLERMDAFFDNAESWNVFAASRQIRDKGIEDWMWTRRLNSEEELS